LERGRDDALAEFLVAFSHEVIHYQQWVRTGNLSERGVEAKASRMVDRYSTTVDEP